MPSRSSGPRLSWQLPKRSTHSTSAITASPSVRGSGIVPGVRMAGSTSSPRSINATPLHRCAAAGPKMSRPANVAPAASSWYSGLVSSTARSAPPAIATAGASNPLSGPTTTPAPSATSIATGASVGADAGIDDREHDARWHVPDAPGERERSTADVERRDLVGEIDDADVRCDVADHRLHDADELVAIAVVGQERHGVVAPRGRHRFTVTRVIARHDTGVRKPSPDATRAGANPPMAPAPSALPVGRPPARLNGRHSKRRMDVRKESRRKTCARDGMRWARGAIGCRSRRGASQLTAAFRRSVHGIDEGRSNASVVQDRDAGGRGATRGGHRRAE